jgi:hypothetical protein
MTKSELIDKMGDAIGEMDGDGRYPYLEQDAMRYWVHREFIAKLGEITPERLDEMTDAFINKLLAS